MFFVCTVRWWEKCETFCAVLTKNVNETVKKNSRLGCFLIDSGQTGKSIYAAICLVQYWLQLKVDGTALKLTVSKVRVFMWSSITFVFNGYFEPLTNFFLRVHLKSPIGPVFLIANFLVVNFFEFVFCDLS